MQPNEVGEAIFVLVIDETYGINEERYETESEIYRLKLEAEFGAGFQQANVGPGFDIPAFLTVLDTVEIPLWSVIAGSFFLGKPINENLQAWKQIYDRLIRFFDKPVVLSRNGAAVIAVQSVFEEMGGLPKALRLRSYKVGFVNESDQLETLKSTEEISPSPPTLNLGQVGHLFEIEADGTVFRVSVRGKETEIIQIN